MTSRQMNEMLHEGLTEVWRINPKIFKDDILSGTDIEAKYDVFRSFRRGSDSRAMDQGVKQVDIDVVNRWKREERAGHRKPAFQNLSQYYADVTILLGPFLRYTRAM